MILEGVTRLEARASLKTLQLWEYDNLTLKWTLPEIHRGPVAFLRYFSIEYHSRQRDGTESLKFLSVFGFVFRVVSVDVSV